MLNLEQNDGLLSAISATFSHSFGVPIHLVSLLVVIRPDSVRFLTFRFGLCGNIAPSVRDLFLVTSVSKLTHYTETTLHTKWHLPATIHEHL